ncbi:MAG: c-type cytochrome [Candidatus Binataceae bacterium]
MKRWLMAIGLACAIAAPALAGEKPRELYLENCYACHHEPTSKGFAGGVPSMSTLGYFLNVPGGRAYLLRAPNMDVSAVSDPQLASVLNWLMITYNKKVLPKNFKPFTAAEIAKYRPHPLTVVTPVREALVKEIDAKGLDMPDTWGGTAGQKTQAYAKAPDKKPDSAGY